jgi:hypothetical protein
VGLNGQCRSTIFEIKLQGLLKISHCLLLGVPFACDFDIKTTSDVGTVFGERNIFENALHGLHFKDARASLLVPGGGIEPPWCHHRRILSPLRLPIPPSRRGEGRIML